MDARVRTALAKDDHQLRGMGIALLLLGILMVILAEPVKEAVNGTQD